jgi:hypothetical protein
MKGGAVKTQFWKGTIPARFGLHMFRGLRRSEWVILDTKWAIFQLYHGENKLHFDETIMISSL